MPTRQRRVCVGRLLMKSSSGVNMSINSIYRLSVEGQCLDSGLVNVVHYRCDQSNGSTEDEMNALASLFASEIIPIYQTLCPTSVAFTGLKVRTTTLPRQGLDWPVTANGSSASDQVANQVSPELILRTRFLGASYRGRMFLFPCSEGDINSGSLTLAYRTAATNMAGAMQVLSGTVGGTPFEFELCIYSKKLSSATPVASWQMPFYARTQRRRRVGKGS